MIRLDLSKPSILSGFFCFVFYIRLLRKGEVLLLDGGGKAGEDRKVA